MRESRATAAAKIPLVGSVRNIIAELRKVAWPSREEATRLTVIVLVVTVAIAIVLWGVDTAFSEFVDAVLLR